MLRLILVGSVLLAVAAIAAAPPPDGDPLADAAAICEEHVIGDNAYAPGYEACLEIRQQYFADRLRRRAELQAARDRTDRAQFRRDLEQLRLSPRP